MAWCPLPLRVFSAASLALFLALAMPSPAQALVCTDEDIQSKNAEKCAKKYASTLRKCLKKGIPLAICDTSKSDKFCDLLSVGCTVRQDVTVLSDIVYESLGGEGNWRKIEQIKNNDEPTIDMRVSVITDSIRFRVGGTSDDKRIAGQYDPRYDAVRNRQVKRDTLTLKRLNCTVSRTRSERFHA